jgi:Delta carbonic anhydrase
LGAEHYSVGEYDENGSGPVSEDPVEARQGFQCHFYDETDAKFTTEYEWEHCLDMEVGQTYEVHWPHSSAGACGTPWQYQSPFLDGVFCIDGIIELKTEAAQVGVAAQVFVVVNDESYYQDDLFNGMMMVDDTDVAYYTGSTTGTSFNNTVCSGYTPITWQVDRKCHLISASSFDKMCREMKAQPDDMEVDLDPQGSRELVDDRLAANNQHLLLRKLLRHNQMA